MEKQVYSEKPRLIADAMLGKLARWLRVLGFDTLYDRGEDAAIAALARSQGRVLLTRDREFAKRRGLQVVLIDSQVLDEQIVEVITALGVEVDSLHPRCMACNVALNTLTPEQATPLVPPYIAQIHREFHQCPQCEKVYWRGTHWTAIARRLRKISCIIRRPE